MDQERDEARQVEEARQRVADDLRSVTDSANVVQRAKDAANDKIEGAKGTVQDRLSDVKTTLQGSVETARGVVRDRMQQAGEAARNVNVNPTENPIGMLIAGLAVGFLVGLALPVTRFESERIGPIAQDMKGRVRDARDEAVRRGGEAIKDTISDLGDKLTS